MSDLIDRRILIKDLVSDCLKVKEEIKQLSVKEIYKRIEALIDKQKQIEAKPVVHGSWETEFTALLVVYRCSECNCATALGQTNFCPNCGADMRKKVE